jgi:hypothetical protein
MAEGLRLARMAKLMWMVKLLRLATLMWIARLL